MPFWSSRTRVWLSLAKWVKILNFCSQPRMDVYWACFLAVCPWVMYRPSLKARMRAPSSQRYLCRFTSPGNENAIQAHGHQRLKAHSKIQHMIWEPFSANGASANAETVCPYSLVKGFNPCWSTGNLFWRCTSLTKTTQFHDEMAHGLHFCLVWRCPRWFWFFSLSGQHSPCFLSSEPWVRFYIPSETFGTRVNLIVLMLCGRCWATRCASDRGRSCMALEPCLKDETWNPCEL